MFFTVQLNLTIVKDDIHSLFRPLELLIIWDCVVQGEVQIDRRWQFHQRGVLIKMFRP